MGALWSLAGAGIRCFVSATDDRLAADSRWFSPAHCSEDFDELLATPDSIRKFNLEGVVLIPCSDSTALAVARLVNESPEKYFASSCSEQTLLLFQDKKRFAKLLQDQDISHPMTVVVNGESELQAVDFTKLSNAFLKPADSQSFVEHYGTKAIWVRTKTEALDQWRSARKRGFDLMLQEYVPGNSSDHYYIDGFVDRTGRLCGQFARRRLRIFPQDFGNSTLMVSIAISEVEMASKSLSQLLAATEYRGIFSAEFKRHSETGEFCLIEVNTRAWWYVDFARRCGVDVCKMAYDDALGRQVEIVTDYRLGKRCVYPHRDYSAYREASKDSKVSLMKWIAPWFGAFQPVFRFADPMPACKATVALLVDAFSRRFRR